jgi:hypothetical protein
MSSLKKYKSASSVIRIYDKDLEMIDKQNEYLKYYPPGIDEDVEASIEISDDGYLLGKVRIEIQMRRRKLRYELKSKSVLVSDMFNDDFQKSIINMYFERLGLNRYILCKYNFRNHIYNKYNSKSKQSRIIECARLIRNKKKPNANISIQTYNNYVRELKADGVHIITSNIKNLQPINPL